MGEILEGDCLEVMAGMEENSVDSIVCDPPYALGFIGKAWDRFPTDKGPKKPFANQSKESKLGGMPYQEWCRGWAMECLRVAKPGAYLLAFGGTRTFHRLAVAIEDAGWTLRDALSWNYGSGFPKSHDVSKALDRKRNDSIRHVCCFIRAALEKSGHTAKQIAERFGFHPRMVEHWAARDTDSQPTVVRWEQWEKLKELLKCGDEMDAEIWRLNGRKGKPGDNWEKREVVGKHRGDMGGLGGERLGEAGGDITAPATPEAKQWDGFGTALKPAWEPVLLFQKPLEGTYAENVLKWGCGALNIDGCRIGGSERRAIDARAKTTPSQFGAMGGSKAVGKTTEGRWPANILLSHTIFCEKVGEREAEGYAINRFTDGAKPFGGGAGHPYKSEKQGGQVEEVWRCVPDCPVAILDGQSGESKSGGRSGDRRGGIWKTGSVIRDVEKTTAPSQGFASRFFYVAKASREERNAGLEAVHTLFEKREGMEDKVQHRMRPDKGVATGLNTDPRWGPKISKNNHPTVKPIALMRYLCRLVTPPGGTVLDCFAGSGSTGCAAVLEGFEIIGIEKEKGYAEIARARIAHFSGRKP